MCGCEGCIEPELVRKVVNHRLHVRPLSVYLAWVHELPVIKTATAQLQGNWNCKAGLEDNLICSHVN